MLDLQYRKLAFLLLLFALPAQAQYVQGGSVNAAPDTIGGDWTAKTSYSYTFPKPLTSPCTVMVSIRGPEQSVSDSQGNSFTLATGNPGRSDRLFYSTTCGSAADTVTVSCPSACWAQFTVSGYAGVWVPDQLSPEVLNVTGVDGYTAPITPTQDGELIVVIGNNHTTNSPGITGVGGFTVRANANQFIGDLLQVKAAPVYGEVTYATPVLWCQRTISFKRTDKPPAVTDFGFYGALRYCKTCDATDDTSQGMSVYTGAKVDFFEGPTLLFSTVLDSFGNFVEPVTGLDLSQASVNLNVQISTPAGTFMNGISQTVDTAMLKGMASIHVTIGLDITTTQPRSLHIWTAP